MIICNYNIIDDEFDIVTIDYNFFNDVFIDHIIIYSYDIIWLFYYSIIIWCNPLQCMRVYNIIDDDDIVCLFYCDDDTIIE